MSEMRIKSLEMQGFKSFPDKTVINFDGGVTIIVGPNGSGKSNISDAIRWVLGEISSKNIRGNKMEDVIFGGTDTRRQMGFAEVSLSIDNTDPNNRMNIDYDEVTVTRRYYRTGESEYFINAKPVRLKDISEMFMNTGIGRTGYSVIGQGKIAEIISQKSDDRRIIFEEAAGISKYRYKKKEAERKLDETNDNLVRITDILSELESRVGPLEKEASKARTYLDLYDEKKQADISLWLYDIEDIKSQFESVDANYTVSSKELEIIDDIIASLENQNDKAFEEQQEAKRQSELCDKNIREYTEKFHSLESSGKVLENDIKHYESQISHLEIEKKESEDALIALTEQRNEFSHAYDAESDALKEADSRFKESVTALEETRKEIFRLESERDAKLEEARAVSDSVIELKAKLESLSDDEGAPDIEETKNELEKCRENDKFISDRIEKAQATIAAYTAQIDAAKEEVQSLKDTKSKEYNEEKLSLTAKKDKLALKSASAHQRLATLKRMAEHFEGYASSVKFIMNEKAAGKLPGVIGTVSDIIDVGEKHTVAIETALGNNIQNIVCDDEATTKAAISLLKENRAGRATFFPVSSITAQPLNVDRKTIESSKGYVGYADTLVRRDRKYDEIVKNLLGRTVVFDNLDNATAMERAIGYKIKCVTLDGQIINTGGSFTGGSSRRESGILSRALEMEEIQKDIVRLESEEKETEKLLSECEKNADDVNFSISDMESKIAILTSLCSAEDTQMQVLSAQKDAEKAQAELLLSSLRSHEEAEKHKKEEIERITALITEKEGLSEKIKEEINISESLCREAHEALDSAIDAKNSLLIEITSKEKDAAAAKKQIDDTDTAILSVKEDCNAKTAQIALYNQKLISIKNQISANAKSLGGATEELEAFEKRSAELRDIILSLDVKINSLRTEYKDKTHERELKYREYTLLETKRASLLSKQDGMASKIWDDYELTYASACALGYPEVTKDTRPQIAAKVNEFRNKLRALGPINVGAIDEYSEVKQRYDFLSNQVNDLNNSREDLTGIIDKLETEMRNKFAAAMQEINVNFKAVFKELFGGGNADLVLTDPDNILESGIDINVAPPGKIIKNLQLLSGGEQVFVAIALYFAILKVNPSPFCLLDEIEAALDEVNVTKFAEYAKKFSNKTQFIIITHRRGTMEVADSLYGITMQERGISKVLSINVNEVEKKIGVKLG